jgi:hypothetical protein
MGLIARHVKKHWPGACVPYTYLNTSGAENAMLDTARLVWEARGIRFIKRSTQQDYLTFKPDSNPLAGNAFSDVVGRTGGQQFIYFGPLSSFGLAVLTGQVIHEIGHALGFHHEHQRPDRDSFITVHREHIDPFYQYAFDVLNESDARMVGGYDFDSIMHYDPFTFSKDGEKTITTNDAANESHIGNLTGLSTGDIVAAERLTRGNALVVQLTGNGQIEKTVQRDTWGDGWTTASHYTIGSNNYMFFLKNSNGRAHVSPIDMGGSIGGTIYRYNWTGDWTHAVPYTIGLSSYMLFYKHSGRVDITHLEADGKIGPLLNSDATGTIEAGWTSIAHYLIGVNNFMIFVNKDTGAMRVRNLELDGSFGGVVETKTWGKEWTTIEPFTVGGNNYLLTLKSSDGQLHVARINDDGTIGSNVDERNWKGGWTSGIPYQAGSDVYLFLMKSASGELDICRIRSNGRIGPTTDHREFGPGWTTAVVYGVGLGTYALLFKGG